MVTAEKKEPEPDVSFEQCCEDRNEFLLPSHKYYDNQNEINLFYQGGSGQLKLRDWLIFIIMKSLNEANDENNCGNEGENCYEIWILFCNEISSHRKKGD